MSRVEIPTTVQSGTYPVSDASVWIYLRGTTTEVPVYDAEAGGSVLAQPLKSHNGRVDGWVAPGQSLDVHVEWGQYSATEPWEAIDASELIIGSGHLIEDETTPLAARGKLSFQGSAVAVSDDAANNRTVVNITAGGSKHLVEDETTPVADRGKLSFQGAGVTVTDDAANDRTIATIPGAAGPHVIEDETTARTQRAKLSFQGTAVAATDDAANDRTVVTVTVPIVPFSAIFAQAGNAATGPSHKVYLPRALTLTLLRLSTVTAPVGSALTVEVSKNGVVISTLTIAAGSTTAVTATPGTAFAVGETISVNATSVGSTTPATGVAIQADLTP